MKPSLFGSILTYLREHLAGAIVTAIASALVTATGAVVIPPGSGTVNGWRDEIRDVFSRVEANSTSPARVVQRPWGTVELFFGDALEPSAADLQKAVLHTNTGVVKYFYFSGGDVVFVFRLGPSGRPPRMAGENEGDRYYFRRGARFRLFFSKQRLIYWIAPGKRVVSPDHLDYAGAERSLLREAREILRVATS